MMILFLCLYFSITGIAAAQWAAGTLFHPIHGGSRRSVIAAWLGVIAILACALLPLFAAFAIYARA